MRLATNKGCRSRERSSGASLVELSAVLGLVLLLGFAFFAYAVYFGQRVVQSNAVTQIAFKVRVYCEMFPDDLVQECLKQIVDQATPIIQQTRTGKGKRVQVRVSVLKVNKGGNATLLTSYATPEMVGRFTQASFNAQDAQSKAVFGRVGRAYVTEVSTTPKLTNVPFVKVLELYDRVVG